MTYKFTISGKLPGLNDYINAERSNRYIAAKMKKQAEQIILWSLGKKIKFDKPVFITYRWVEKDRRRDKDNICFAKKFIQDALVRAKVLKNDGWNDIADFKDSFDIDSKNPRIEVTITEVEL